jgi:peptidoglycan/LPS O-acetylase OafA/YrhL
MIAFASLLALGLYFASPMREMPPGTAITATLLALLVLPWLTQAAARAQIFPMIPALWSLFFELAVNLAYGLCHRWLGNRVLAGLVLLCGVVVAGWGFAGDTATNFPLGFFRVSFGFFLGVLLFRLRAAGRLPAIRLHLLPAGLLVLAVMAIPYPVPYAGWMESLLGAAVVILGVSNARTGPRTAAVAAVLGAISYPLYLIHQPLLGFARPLLGALWLSPLTAAALLASLGLAAWLVVRLYETPVRRLLARRSA